MDKELEKYLDNLTDFELNYICKLFSDKPEKGDFIDSIIAGIPIIHTPEETDRLIQQCIRGNLDYNDIKNDIFIFEDHECKVKGDRLLR